MLILVSFQLFMTTSLVGIDWNTSISIQSEIMATESKEKNTYDQMATGLIVCTGIIREAVYFNRCL